MNCSKTINKLTKDLEAEQQQMWNEELKYARGKEAVSYTTLSSAQVTTGQVCVTKRNSEDRLINFSGANIFFTSKTLIHVSQI